MHFAGRQFQWQNKRSQQLKVHLINKLELDLHTIQFNSHWVPCLFIEYNTLYTTIYKQKRGDPFSLKT